MQALTQQCLVGDFYICASERQRDWWLGLLEANGRVNPATFGADPSLRRLVAVVPYGLPTQMPPPTRAVIKGVWPGIAPTDKLLLWGGGLWPWLDPVTAIRAMAKVWATRQDVKLIFPGTRHPNPQVASAPTQNAAALAEATTLGLLNQAVFFGDWVPYADWPNVLHESTLALTLHYDSLETRLAFRSRVLEYIGAGLPMIATQGDATSELIAHYGLGVIVDYADADGVATAIEQLLTQPVELMRSRFAQAQAELSWEQAAAPLVAFCRQPQRAADKCIQPPVTGNPYYAQFQVERDRLRTVVQGYERGRVMRLLNWINRRWQGFRQP
jgi:glycosyltransferase involved in cell wall biosynthesis